MYSPSLMKLRFANSTSSMLDRETVVDLDQPK